MVEKFKNRIELGSACETAMRTTCGRPDAPCEDRVCRQGPCRQRLRYCATIEALRTMLGQETAVALAVSYACEQAQDRRVNIKRLH